MKCAVFLSYCVKRCHAIGMFAQLKSLAINNRVMLSLALLCNDKHFSIQCNSKDAFHSEIKLSNKINA